MFGPPGTIDFDLEVFVATVIAFVVAITIHEFMHAWTALQLGDATAYNEGRVTLNPISHLDPIGFILMLFLALGIGVIAWGRPVPVNLNRLRNGKSGYALVSIAGPASNLILATAVMLPLRLSDVELIGFSGLLIERLILLNLLLTAFNMIPIPPLDGSKILTGILPDFWYPYLVRLEQYGFVILLVLIFLAGGTIQAMYGPVYQFLYTNIVGPVPL